MALAISLLKRDEIVGHRQPSVLFVVSAQPLARVSVMDTLSTDPRIPL
ncbi:MAG: hypothetical protein JOZ18_18890 [Chloroflexi bacterium]|nr:hypothetical protein [Chloroflexota bacterium]